MSLVKVISTKTVFGDKERILETVMKDKAREHFLYRVFGAIDASMTGKGRHQRVNRETNQAEDTFWTKFYGEFYAVNSDKGEYESATLFLPEYVSGQFKSQLENGVTGITFAYDIFAVYNKDSITSYEFIAQPVKSGEESKVLGMASAFPALPNEAKPKQIGKSK
jgi:hypothetical protein